MTLHLSEAVCRNPNEGLAREWLETDGAGGYASSTVLNCHTRKYHGMLVSHLPPPANGRHVLLSRLDLAVGAGDDEIVLSDSEYQGKPCGTDPLFLTAFTESDYPNWLYRFQNLEIRQSLVLLYRQSAALFRFQVRCEGAAMPLSLRPLVAYRGMHTTVRKNSVFDGTASDYRNGFRIAPYAGMPPLFVCLEGDCGPRVRPAGHWYRNVVYRRERERGYPFVEDLFLPAEISLQVQGQQTFFVLVSTQDLAGLQARWDGEVRRRAEDRQSYQRWFHQCGLDVREEEFPLVEFCRAGGQFLVELPEERPGVVAGYPWLYELTRQSLVALPGLTFACGRMDAGLNILRDVAGREKNGLLPEGATPGEPPVYRSADIPLWFIWAVQQYLTLGGDVEIVRHEFWPVIKRIITWYWKGTGDHIGARHDGLLNAGNGLPLTWMNARVDNVPVTPRAGCQVEVNALWYNALAVSSELARRFGDREYKLPVPLRRLRKAFCRTFWQRDAGCLVDAASRDGDASTGRPNQIFACSLPHSPLSRRMAREVVSHVERELLTPYGLRTLSHAHPDYRGYYEGNVRSRDLAYHQGTVWPWLMGAYGEAILRVRGAGRTDGAGVLRMLGAWKSHLNEAGIGSVSELFDGEWPHEPGGCIAQAWSVAELLRLRRLLPARQRTGGKFSTP